MSSGKLTPTSYALLGLLNLRPWTGYELAQQMDRSLGYIWPRAVSAIYEEPRNLVRQGMAEASRESTGRRPRTVYSITDAGRRALAEWMATPPAPPHFESEALVRISFPEGGSRENLEHNLAEFRRHAEGLRERLARQVGSYLGEDRGPFPGRLHVIVLDARFMTEYVDALLRWVEWAEVEVAAWPSMNPDSVDFALTALNEIALRLDRLPNSDDRPDGS